MTSSPTKISADSAKLQEIINNAKPNEMLRLAKLVRALYVTEVAATRQQLDPARLRKLDANIAQLEAQAN